MAKRFFPTFFLSACFFAVTAASAPAAEKFKLGTAIKVFPVYYLLIGAAEEKGYWKENNLEPEWIPFTGGPPHMQAVAAGAIRIGIEPGVGVITGASRGLPVVMVAHLQNRSEFPLWVRTDSPIKAPREIKGAKIGVFRLGGLEHGYSRAIAKALGLEKDVRFVATGGPAESVAALKTGGVDAVLTTVSTMAVAMVKGEVRKVLSNEDYLPKGWMGHMLYARKDYIKERPEMVSRVLKSLLKAANFVIDNPAWAVAKVVKEHGLPEEAARALHESFEYNRDGKIERKRLENVSAFLVEYGIIPKEKTPAVEEVHTRDFTG